MNQSDWDDDSLAAGGAAYGNGGRDGCPRVHGADGVLGETREAVVQLVLLDGNVGRSGHHLKVREKCC